MNEKIENTFQKFGDENTEFFKDLINKITKEYKENGINVSFDLENEYIVYNRSDGAKVKFLRWKKIPKKNDEPVPIGDKLRQAIDEDIRVDQAV